ncbi:MAG: chloride channel protein [Bacteroidales bacterium]|nr:chloride channel protein [Bacteroidales bacterium]
MNKANNTNHKKISAFYLFLLAILVGVIAGFGAVVFRGMIAVFHNLLFLGKFSVFYDANIHTPESIWGWGVIFVPVVGALGVAFLVKNFAPEAKGHGVPEVMDAIYYNKGVIRPVVAVVKSLASALSIGSGGAIGREGPIIQIGASFGSTLGQILPLSRWQRLTLIAAGAGGGIAATFNSPVGGILFAIEIMMVEVSVRTLVPVAISTAVATYIGRLIFGAHPSFIVPALKNHYFHPENPWEFLIYIVLGLIIGVVAVLYIKSIYAFEDFFDKRIPGNYYTRHMMGMLIVGIMMYVMMKFYGHYYVEGVGYSTVQDILSNVQTPLYLLLLLFVLKLLATSLTLGSGASGGIFSPSLFMGATLGGAFGILINHFFPGINLNPAAFAVAGMAGMVGSSTGAVMTAIVMIFEMTLDYTVIIPMAITVAIAYQVRFSLLKQSIYTLKLERRGHYIPPALETNFHQIKLASDIMNPNFMILDHRIPDSALLKEAKKYPDVQYFLLKERQQITGLITRQTLLEENFTLSDPEGFNTRFLLFPESEILLPILSQLKAREISHAILTHQDVQKGTIEVSGIISKEELGESFISSVELFSE